MITIANETKTKVPTPTYTQPLCLHSPKHRGKWTKGLSSKTNLGKELSQAVGHRCYTYSGYMFPGRYQEVAQASNTLRVNVA